MNRGPFNFLHTNLWGKCWTYNFPLLMLPARQSFPRKTSCKSAHPIKINSIFVWAHYITGSNQPTSRCYYWRSKDSLSRTGQWLCTCVIILCSFLCRPLQNNNVKWPNSALSGKREPRRLMFLIFISNISLCSGLRFTIVLTVINKGNEFRVLSQRFPLHATKSSVPPPTR